MNHLGVTLQRTPRLPIDIDNLTIWVTREVNSNVNHNLRHLLVDLSLVVVNRVSLDPGLPSFLDYLLFGLFFLDIGLQFTGDGRHFMEETKFSIVEFLGLP